MDIGLLNKDFFSNFFIINTMGISFAKMVAVFAVGFNLSRIFVRILRGNIRIGVAISDLIRDTMIFLVIGYVIGALGIGEVIIAHINSITEPILKILSSFGVNDSVTSGVAEIASAAGAKGNFLPVALKVLPSLAFGALIGGIFSFIFES